MDFLILEKGFNKLMDAINILESLNDFSDNSWPGVDKKVIALESFLYTPRW